MRRIIYLVFLIGSFQASIAQTTYPIVWTDVNNLTVNANNTLTAPATGPSWTSGAASKNMLYPATDGYVEFVFAGGTYMVGLSKYNTDPSYASSDISLYMQATTLLPYKGATSQGSAIAIAVGDVIRLSRETSTCRVYKNGTQIFASSGFNTGDGFRVDVSMATGTTTPVFNTSFQVPLLASPVIQNPSTANNDGSISLTLDGQTAPVTYSWSSGETTSSISGKARGTYTVTVTDGAGKTLTRTYTLGYAVAWTNLKNVNITGNNRLQKADAIGSWTAGASSLNYLPPNVNGYLEFVVEDPGAMTMIGLSRIDIDETYPTIAFADNIAVNNSLSYYELGTNWSNAATTTLIKGDVIRISRESTVVKYYLNGVLRRTSPTMPFLAGLVVDVSIGSNAVPIPQITASFDKQIRVAPTITQPNSANQNGSISLSVQGTYAPYTLTWTGGETSSIISGKPRGSYTVNMTDAASHTFSRTYRLGYPVSWTDLQNATVNPDNSIYKTVDGTGLWDASALSSNALAPTTDGWIEFTLPPATSTAMVGLSKFNTVTAYASLDYAFYFTNGFVYVFEAGTNISNPASQVEGAIYSISREGGFIKYYINGTAVRTVATTAGNQLFADAAIYKGKLPPVTASFGRTPQTFYAIADGAWNAPATWSLAEGGAPATVYPADQDIAVIKSNTVTVNSGIVSGGVRIYPLNENGVLKVDGIAANLIVKGDVQLKGETNAKTTKSLILQNNGRINVQAP
ncbi:hypothetical protein [Chryseolinea soli]|nr:hypothetical protein [Chryseolinea soli]